MGDSCENILNENFGESVDELVVELAELFKVTFVRVSWVFVAVLLTSKAILTSFLSQHLKIS